MKYGRIEERLNVPKNEFTTKTGKTEVPYEKFMEKMNYTKFDQDLSLKNNYSMNFFILRFST